VNIKSVLTKANGEIVLLEGWLRPLIAAAPLRAVLLAFALGVAAATVLGHRY
jgi:hypothetical protein